MSDRDRDDLATLLMSVQVGTDDHGDDATLMDWAAKRIADAIIEGGWVSAERHQEALDAMALQVTYTEDGTWDVLRRFREVRAERDSQAETLQRVRDLLDKFANPDSAYRQVGCAPLPPSADALLRATLDEQEAR